MMRRWGVDPDPDNLTLTMAAMEACGPEISDEDAILWRYEAGRRFGVLFLGYTHFSEASLTAIPEDVKCLNFTGAAITDAAIPHLLRLKDLSRLILSETGVTDASLDLLESLPKLCYLAVERTRVTDHGVARLKARLPDLEVKR
jgi:hypothetical protein